MPTIDLNDAEQREALEARILNDINLYCEEKYNEGFRNHLGASIMGEACSRKLWNTFRWIKEAHYEGRMLRLFQVGHTAEPRFTEYLRGIGFEVRTHQPEILHFHPESGSYFLAPEFDPGDGLVENVTGNPVHEAVASAEGIKRKQFRMSGCDGHYGGSLDGMCKPPARYGLAEDVIFLNEDKTNGTGAGFNNVGKKGVREAKPEHYDQMCQYGKHYGLRYGLYIIENKNDSDLIVKIVPLDWNRADELEKKANDIIYSQFAPPKIAKNASYFECKMCPFPGVCHEGEPIAVNCRSCKNAIPVKNKEWQCNKWNNIIPKDEIAKAHPCHEPIV